jgi:non-heme chloroperoxidase
MLASPTANFNATINARSRPDPDLAEQARPGHGIPSQDPNPAAQQPLQAHEAEREAQSAMVGGGLVAGQVIGASLGALAAGPLGLLVGATLSGVAGGVAGAMGGAAAGDALPADTTPSSAEPANRSSPAQLHVEDSGGTGRPVVLIHGWPLSSAAWSEQTADLVAAGYRVVAYDRRGFGQSDCPSGGFDYDTFAEDLQAVITERELHDVTLVGLSMGGGEVARYVARHAEARLRSVVFAAAVPPFLMQSPDNPAGPLTPEKADAKAKAFTADRDAYYQAFVDNFFSADGVMLATPAQREAALRQCAQANPEAALACMGAFANTDFRTDLTAVTVPPLVLHGSADAVVPLAGSGERTHRAVRHSELVVFEGAPHGLNVTHAGAFNGALLGFLARPA